MPVVNDPCLTCPLPDCDDGSPECPLRKAAAAVSRKNKAGRNAEITEAERAAYNFWFTHVWRAEKLARDSERNAA